MVAGEFVALLVTTRLPLVLPVWGGAKEADRVRLWPAESVTAPEKPLTEKPVPLVVTDDTVTLPVPVFFSETD